MVFHFNTKNLLRCGEYILQNYVFVDFGGDDSNHGIENEFMLDYFGWDSNRYS